MKKKINAKFIRTLNPCERGINNFEKHYPKFDGSLEELLRLDNIPYNDKIWLVVKIVDYKILQRWSLECAKTVEYIYNKQFPKDKRISDCLIKTEKYLNNEISLEELESARSAAQSAADSAELAAYSAAWSAAYSAARLAAESAYSAASAAYSAAQSAEWSAEWSAESAELAAESAELAAESAEKDQETLNLLLLISLLQE